MLMSMLPTSWKWKTPRDSRTSPKNSAPKLDPNHPSTKSADLRANTPWNSEPITWASNQLTTQHRLRSSSTSSSKPTRNKVVNLNTRLESKTKTCTNSSKLKKRWTVQWKVE
jgi:hypothetical protein